MTRVSCCDTNLDTWQDVAPLPLFAPEAAAVVFENVLHVFPGDDIGDGREGNAWAYDPAANAWTERLHPPIRRVGVAVATTYY